MRRCIASALVAAALGFSAFAQDPAKVAGTWAGRLALGRASLRVVLNLTMTNGSLSASLDSPDQGAKGIPFPALTLTGDRLEIASPALGASYSGRLSADGAKLSGTWTQGGSSLPLDLERQGSSPQASPVPGAAETNGPAQDAPAAKSAPAAEPTPYRVEEISIAGKAAGVKLAGSLVIPEGKGPFPAILLVTGSGQQDRDEQILGHRPFFALADYLARRGVMSLRCDDRGVGGSTGEVARATTFDFADDAEAELEFLASRPEARRGAIGMIGHSEGGLIAPIVAARNLGVGFLVLLAGPGLPGSDIILAQGRLIAKAEGASEADIEAGTAFQREICAAALAADETAAKASVKAMYLKRVKEAAPGLGEAALEAQAEATATAMTSPWYRTFLALNPADTLKKLRIPVLALNGSKDLQVPADENLAAIESSLREAPGGIDPKSRLLRLEGLNHLFQRATTGSPSEYATIAEDFSPEALVIVGDWILSL